MIEDDIEQILEAVGHQLPGSPLAGLSVFNRSYLVVTRALMAKPRGFFADPEAAQQLDLCFLRYYLEAIDGFLGGQTGLPAWREVMRLCDNGSSRLLILALSVNAHVGADLVMSMQDVGVDRRFRRDLWNKYRVIAGCSHEIVRQCEIGIGPRWFWRVEAWGMKLIMGWYTLLAWRRYRRLANGRLVRDQLQRKVSRDARVLRRLPWPQL